MRRARQAHGDPLGLLQRLRRQLLDFRRKGRRKQHGLPLRRHGLDDPLDVRQEAHVEHAVGLVQHQYLDVVETRHALVHQIQQTPGAGDQDLRPIAQGLDLRCRADAPIDGRASQPGACSQDADYFMDLFGQLARGRNDQRPRHASPALQQPIEDGQHEGGRLARARLGRADQIASTQRGRDCRLLNRRGYFIPRLPDPDHEAGIQAKLFEFQCAPLLRPGSTLPSSPLRDVLLPSPSFADGVARDYSIRCSSTIRPPISEQAPARRPLARDVPDASPRRRSQPQANQRQHTCDQANQQCGISDRDAHKSEAQTLRPGHRCSRQWIAPPVSSREMDPNPWAALACHAE